MVKTYSTVSKNVFNVKQYINLAFCHNLLLADRGGSIKPRHLKIVKPPEYFENPL